MQQDSSPKTEPPGGKRPNITRIREQLGLEKPGPYKNGFVASLYAWHGYGILLATILTVAAAILVPTKYLATVNPIAAHILFGAGTGGICFAFARPLKAHADALAYQFAWRRRKRLEQAAHLEAKSTPNLVTARQEYRLYCDHMDCHYGGPTTVNTTQLTLFENEEYADRRPHF
jgi:hypothetical protein